MDRLKIVILIIMVSVILFNCTDEEKNPIPQILSISPESSIAHLPEFTLTVDGRDFVEGSVVVFDGKEKPTTYINPTQLSCIISSEDTKMDIVSNNNNAGNIQTREEQVSVAVRNPEPGGGDSGTSDFKIKENFEFESPRRVFESIATGWIGPMAIDNEDNLFMMLTEITFKKYRGTITPFLVKSEDKGDTWEKPEEITGFNDIGGYNLFTDDKGNIHIFYSNFEGRYLHLYHRIREKDGTWSEAVRISVDDKGALLNIPNHRPFVHGSKLVAIWTIVTPTYFQFPAYSISEDYGATWTKPVWIKDLWNAIWTNAVITDNGNISLVYAQYIPKGIYDYLIDIHTIHSTDNGSTWSDPVLLSNGAGRSFFPIVLYPGSGNDFKVFWIFQKTGGLVSGLNHYIDMLNTGKVNELLGEKISMTKVMDGTKRTKYPTFHVRMSGSENNGENWTPERNIVDFEYIGDWFDSYGFDVNTDRAGNINLVTNDSHILIGVAGKNGKKAKEEARSYFIRSIDGGLNWTAPVSFSDDPNLSATFISSDSKGNIYIMMSKTDQKRWYYFDMEPYFTRSIR